MCWRVRPGLSSMNSLAVLRWLNIQSMKSWTFTFVPWKTATCPAGVSLMSNGGFRFRDMALMLAGNASVLGSGERLQVGSREHPLAEIETERILAAACVFVYVCFHFVDSLAA